MKQACYEGTPYPAVKFPLGKTGGLIEAWNPDIAISANVIVSAG